MATDEKIITDEQKEEARLAELAKKSDATEDEKKELIELKDKRQTRLDKRIGELTYKRKLAEEEAEAERKKREELEARLKELEETARPKTAEVEETYIEIGGKKWLTDDALIAKINAKEITEAEAIRYQQKRNKEEIKLEVLNDIKNESKRESESEVRAEDAREVLKKYPHFAKTHPDYNPEDPLFKLTTEIYTEGYNANPRGLSKAVERARQILRMTDGHVDKTDDLSMEDGDAPARNGSVRDTSGKDKEVKLTEQEKEGAIRMWCRGDYINPKTGKAYTETEAVAKALNAKKLRS